MLLTPLAFYMFAIVLVASGAAVVFARNSVHAVLFLILCFFNAAGLFVLQGAEFVAMILVIVYVGAVAVLFLFVVMMLDIEKPGWGTIAKRSGPVAALVGVVLGVQLIILGMAPAPNMTVAEENLARPTPLDISNTKAIASVLYTDYFYAFQVAGLILLIAIIGAITLTLRERPGVRRQKSSEQISRLQSETITVVQVQAGEGVKL